MKKILMVFILFICMAYVVKAQQNNAKLYLTPFAFLEARLGFERVITPKTSLQGTVGMLIPRKLPNVLYDETVVTDYGGDVDLLNSLSGFTIGLEYRFYPGSKKEIPRGFYLGPYFKYNHYSVKTSSAFEYTLTQDEYANDLTPNQQMEASPNPDGTFTMDVTSNFVASFNQMGLGIQIGYQWLISDRISVDFTIIGLGVESDAFIVDISSESIPVDYSEWGDEIQTEVRSFVNNDFYDLSDKVEVQTDSDNVRVSLRPVILPAFKLTMISIGFAF